MPITQTSQQGQGFPVTPDMTPAGRIEVAGATLITDGLGNICGWRSETDTSCGVASAGMLFNGSTFDRARANTTGTALASASRNATTASALLTNHNARGGLFVLDVTVNPGAAQTLTLRLRARDPITATVNTFATGAAQAFGGVAGQLLLMVYPGATVAPAGGTGSAVQNTAVPREFVVEVVHSGAGAWTYSVSFQLIV